MNFLVLEAVICLVAEIWFRTTVFLQRAYRKAGEELPKSICDQIQERLFGYIPMEPVGPRAMINTIPILPLRCSVWKSQQVRSAAVLTVERWATCSLAEDIVLLRATMGVCNPTCLPGRCEMIEKNLEKNDSENNLLIYKT